MANVRFAVYALPRAEYQAADEGREVLVEEGERPYVLEVCQVHAQGGESRSS